jgi:uncharacterized protein (TIGR02246 family)
MKSSIIPVLFLILTSAVYADAVPVTDHRALEAEVKSMLGSSMAMQRQNDYEALARRFTPYGYLKLPGRPMISGHKALSEHYQAILQSNITSFDSSIVALDFSDAGDVAILIMEFQATLSTPEGSVDNGGAILMVLRKVEDDWRIFAESVSAGPVNFLE